MARSPSAGGTRGPEGGAPQPLLKEFLQMGSYGLKRSRGRISHAKALAACTGAALLAGGAMAVGAIPSSNGTINACYSKKTGAMRIVDVKEKCGKKETRLTWNEKGVKGDSGAAGATGARGPMGPTGP